VCTPSERRQLPATASPSMASLSPSLHLPWYASFSRLLPSFQHPSMPPSESGLLLQFLPVQMHGTLWFHPRRSRITPVVGVAGWFLLRFLLRTARIRCRLQLVLYLLQEQVEVPPNVLDSDATGIGAVPICSIDW
jgi:hypothetical protein